jgi:predicted nucleotidyltransferase
MKDRSEIVKQIKETLQRVAPTAQSFVYGSQARGDFRPDSDIDLLIIVDEDRLSIKEEQQITIPLYEIEMETGIPISAMIVLKKNWEKRPFKTPFQINIMNEGIVL